MQMVVTQMAKKLTPKQIKFADKPIKYKHIYLMRCGKYHKVGITNNPGARLIQVQTNNPEKVSLVFHRQVLNTEMVERKLHYVLRRQRIRGEWFDIPGELVEAIIDDVNQYEKKLYEYFKTR
jgi:hypothetical protein